MVGAHPERGTSCDGASLRWRRCAIGGDRRWAVRAHPRGWLPSVLQSRRCLYPVGVTDGGLPLRVMSELAPITLERDVVTSDLSRYRARCSHSRLLGEYVDSSAWRTRLEGKWGKVRLSFPVNPVLPSPEAEWAAAAFRPRSALEAVSWAS